MGRTQIISSMQMYLDHYALFEEPDDGIPTALYINSDKLPDFSLELVKPVAVQHFKKEGNDLVLSSRYFKTMPYQIAPAGLSPPIPPEVLAFFSSALGRPVQASEVTPLMVAVGQFDLPAPSSVVATIQGDVFKVKKDVHFRVQIRIAFLYEPLHLGVLAPFVTNQQAADALSIPVPGGVDPAAALAYDWGAQMELSTENSFVEPVSSLPPAFADPFPPTRTQVELRGERLHGTPQKYRIVGSATNVVPVSTVPQILQVLFGTLTPSCRFAYAEEGTLLPL